MLLSVYLNITDQHKLDEQFLSDLKGLDCSCPVHHEELRITKGFKLSPNISLSLQSEGTDEGNPFALCWSKGFYREKHGPNLPTLIVYCEHCQKNKERQLIA